MSFIALTACWATELCRIVRPCTLLGAVSVPEPEPLAEELDLDTTFELPVGPAVGVLLCLPVSTTAAAMPPPTTSTDATAIATNLPLLFFGGATG